MLNLSLHRTYTFVEEDEEQSPQYEDRPALRWFSKFVCVYTFILIFAGAMVTSNQAGLAVPDWPTSYGHNMFLFPYSEWKGNIFYEHLHRLIASGAGFLAIVLSFWIWKVEERKSVRLLACVALAAVICQGILGGVTVLLQLPAFVSSLHGILGQTFFVLTILLAYSQSLEAKQTTWIKAVKHGTHLYNLAVWSTVLIYCQLIIGAIMRHTESGLAIPDFPSMGGSYLPWFTAESLAQINQMRESLTLAPVSMEQVLIHFLHRFSAVLVTLGVLLLSVRVYIYGIRIPSIFRASFYLPLLVFFQIMLGIYTVLSYKHHIITSLHVLSGALLLGLSVLLCARLYMIAPFGKREKLSR